MEAVATVLSLDGVQIWTLLAPDVASQAGPGHWVLAALLSLSTVDTWGDHSILQGVPGTVGVWQHPRPRTPKMQVARPPRWDIPRCLRACP